MNTDFLKTFARKNWPFLAALAALWAVIGFYGGQSLLSTATEAPVASAAAVRAPQRSAPAPIVDPAALEREAARASILAKVHENEEALKTTTDPVRVAAYMNGIGNMYYQRLQDYEAAAGYFERVIAEHPGCVGIAQTYVQLAMCYERLGQPDKRTATLRRMLEAFPNDSQEYAYAYQELYGYLPATVARQEEPAEVADGGDVAAEPSLGLNRRKSGEDTRRIPLDSTLLPMRYGGEA